MDDEDRKTFQIEICVVPKIVDNFRFGRACLCVRGFLIPNLYSNVMKQIHYFPYSFQFPCHFWLRNFYLSLIDVLPTTHRLISCKSFLFFSHQKKISWNWTSSQELITFVSQFCRFRIKPIFSTSSRNALLASYFQEKTDPAVFRSIIQEHFENRA